MNRKAWLVALGLGLILTGIPTCAAPADDVLGGPNGAAPGQLVLEITYIPDDDPPAPSMNPWAVGWHIGCTHQAPRAGRWHSRVQLDTDQGLPTNTPAVVVMSEDL